MNNNNNIKKNKKKKWNRHRAEIKLLYDRCHYNIFGRIQPATYVLFCGRHPRFLRLVNYYYSQRCTLNNTQTSRLVVRLPVVNLRLSNIWPRDFISSAFEYNCSHNKHSLNKSCYFAKNVCIVYNVSDVSTA